MVRTVLLFVAGALLGVVLAGVPGSAFAGAPAGAGQMDPTTFASCASLTGVLCARVSVPLDYQGNAPGRVPLFVSEHRASGTSRGTVLLLAGGPGQAATDLFDLRSTLWSTLFPGYTLAAFDNRGTGQSAPLRCPRAAPAARCARAIGPARVYYGTQENIGDIESVRRALGVDRLVLFGLSYGRKQALAYAAAYPDHVDRLLLDSVELPTGPDPLGVTSLRAIPAALESICHAHGCSRATTHASADLAQLANRLDSHPLVANVRLYTTHWAPIQRRVRIDGQALLSLATASDLNTGIAVELPAAVKQALNGRPALLERLAGLVSQQDTSDVNDAVFLATTCRDGPFPWPPATPVSGRRALLAKAVARLPKRSLGRFGSWAAGAPTRQCLRWPAPVGAEPVPARFPDVPMLVLAGDRDVRTPLPAAIETASRFPRGRVLVAPGVGHTVIGSSRCADGAVRTWMLGGNPPSRCARVPLTLRPLGLLPVSVESARPLGRMRGVVGRTLAATVATLREAEAAWLVQYPAGWVVGLDGGLLDGEDFDVFRFSAFSDVPGLAVSGRITFSVSKLGALVPGSEHGIVEIGGDRAVHGFVQIRNHRMFGIVGGRHVSLRF